MNNPGGREGGREQYRAKDDNLGHATLSEEEFSCKGGGRGGSADIIHYLRTTRTYNSAPLLDPDSIHKV